jgi:DNA-binding YbaB/EbfC family protein
MARMFDMFKNAHKMRREMGKISAGLAGIEAEGTAGRGAVRVKVDGQMKLKEVTIAPEVFTSGDAKSLEQMLIEAAREAQRKAQKLVAGAMSRMAGTENIPFS